MTYHGLYYSRHRLFSERSAAPAQKPPFEAFFFCEGDPGTIRRVCSTFSDPTEDAMSVVSLALGQSLGISA